MRAGSLFILVFALAVKASFSTAEPLAQGPQHESRENRRGHFMQELNLTDEQKAKMKALKGDRQHLKDLAQRSRESRRSLHEMMGQDDLSDAQVMERVQQYNQQMSELNIERAKHLMEMRKILTPEQRARAIQMFKDRRKEAMERGGGRDFGPFHRHDDIGDNGGGRAQGNDRPGTGHFERPTRGAASSPGGRMSR